MADAALTIGEISRASGVHVETVRYYQGLGIVRTPPRPQSGFRRYDAQDIARLRFIKRAQHLGFTLDEVKALLQLEDGRNCRETRLLAEHKLSEIENKVADLERMRSALQGLIGACTSGKRPRSCPIIATLARGE